MEIRDVLELARDPRFISGIYNYCDRWCERCPFAARCLLYAQKEEGRMDLLNRDLNNEAFWEKIAASLAQALEMLHMIAEERGIDLDAVDQSGIENRDSARREEIRKHELAKASEEYAEMVNTWFESEQELFEQKRDELITMLALETGDEEVQTTAGGISDAIEVIQWYQDQIHVKLMRALMQPDVDFELEDDSFPKDSDGSAKVALIGMDRSIAAWGALREQFPEKSDSILTLLLHLDRLRRKTEQCFPAARSFVRPGFDE